MPKKKKFIDKKNAVTFNLVHRSQQDPLQADDEAPQGVLVPATDNEKSSARHEEQQKFGIYYDDDYNYLQHLRDVKELSQVEPSDVYTLQPQHKNEKKPQIMLPSSVFESAAETKVGLLNKGVAVAGPQPSWDPDIVEALDDDFDFDNPDNQLDDDFISKAMADGPATAEGEGDFGSDLGSDEDGFASDEADMLGSDEEGFFDEYAGDRWASEETRSRFTEYSMTSSVVPRSEALTLVDDRFEKMFEEYDESEVGALDEEEIEGLVDYGKELLNNVLEEYERDKKNSQITLKDFTGPCGHITLPEETSCSDMIDVEVDDKPNKAQWDCESILSTYSNLYNHPTLIEEPKKNNRIKLTKRLGIPEDVLAERGPTLKQREERKSDIEHAPTYRPKDETADEKRLRKLNVKHERKARREEKKATKQAFKEEEKKQQKELLNVRQALTGIHIH